MTLNKQWSIESWIFLKASRAWRRLGASSILASIIFLRSSEIPLISEEGGEKDIDLGSLFCFFFFSTLWLLLPEPMQRTQLNPLLWFLANQQKPKFYKWIILKWKKKKKKIGFFSDVWTGNKKSKMKIRKLNIPLSSCRGYDFAKFNAILGKIIIKVLICLIIKYGYGMNNTFE